jgi:hypothetical protein
LEMVEVTREQLRPYIEKARKRLDRFWMELENIKEEMLESDF